VSGLKGGMQSRIPLPGAENSVTTMHTLFISKIHRKEVITIKEVFIWTTFANVGISLTLFGWHRLRAEVARVRNTWPFALGCLMVGFSSCVWLAYFFG
jgi:hypothetical protein